MFDPKLPLLRLGAPGARLRCHRCAHDAFSTSLGVGHLFVNGEGKHVVLDDPASGARITVSVTCTRCKTEHAPRVELPQVSPGRPGGGDLVCGTGYAIFPYLSEHPEEEDVTPIRWSNRPGDTAPASGRPGKATAPRRK